MLEDEFADDVVKFFHNVFSANVRRMIWRFLREKGEELMRGIWIEVVSAPRIGKSSGVLLGLMKWIVERDIDNYVVLVVVVNKRVGRQLYRYLLGCWKRILRDLRELGWNAGMLAEKMRIRYYEGMESSCLMSKGIHRFEDCLKCPLFQLYHKEWRKVYRFPVPVMDPVILKMCGYCPFHVLFSPVFWRNSFVVVNYKILPLVLSILERINVKKVVVYFDEYLVHLNHRILLGKISRRINERILDLEVEWNGEIIKFRNVVDKYNLFIEKLIKRIFKKYDEVGFDIYERIAYKDDIGLYNGFTKYVEKVLKCEVDLSDVLDDVYDDFVEIVNVVEDFYKRYRLSVFKRFLRYVRYGFAALFRSEYDGKNSYRVIAPEVVVNGVSSGYGGYVYSFVSGLYYLGKEVYVVSSSVEDSDFSYISSVIERSHVRIISPYEGLKYHRLSIVYYRGVVGIPCYQYKKSPYKYVGSLRMLFDDLRNSSGNVAVVIDKESMLLLGKGFERIGWRVEYGRDPENPNVIDYVIVYRPDNSVVLMFHPHGRTSMGVDPPFKDKIESVVIVLGLRSYPRYIVPIPRVFLGVVKSLDGSAVSIGDLGGTYAVVKKGFLFIYDVFSRKYDVHLLIQCIGRYFLSKSMTYILINPRYSVKRIRFFALIGNYDVKRYSHVIGRVFKVWYVDSKGRVYQSEFSVKVAGLSFSEVRRVFKVVKINEFIRDDSSRYVVNLYRVRGYMYNMLRSVYNSLRYAKKQLGYGRQPDKWWLIKKMVYLLNGFEYCCWERLSVPVGLKKMYRIYREKGLESLLEYVKDRYLKSIDSEIWGFVVLYIHKVVKGWLGVELDGDYVKSLISTGEGRNHEQKTLDEYLVVVGG